jgi:hypothetical protein
LPKHRRGTGRRGDRPGAGPGDHRDDDRDPHLRRRPRSRSPRLSWPVMPGRSTRCRRTRSANASLRTSIRTVHNPATSLNRSRQRGSCGCGTVATADSVWTDTSKLRRCRVAVVDRTTRRTATRR